MVAVQDSNAVCPHGNPYDGFEQCGACRAAVASAPYKGSPKADTRELEIREHEYRTDAKYLRKKAREWLDEGTAQERNSVLKAFDAASKYERLALEIRQHRVDIEHDHWLRSEDTKRQGGGD